jgi:hypothetical protein
MQGRVVGNAEIIPKPDDARVASTAGLLVANWLVPKI